MIAPAKTGKSIFCEQMAKGLSRGEPFIHWRPEKPWRVSFVGWDAPDVDYQVQFQAIDPVPHENLQIILSDDPPKMLLDDKVEGARVFEALHQQHRTEFIIFDALESMTSGDINTKEGVQKSINVLKALAGGKPFLLIHHPRKSRTDDVGEQIVEDPRNAAAGHHYLTTNSSTTLSLRGNTTDGELTIVGRRGRSGNVALTRREVHPEVAIWVPGQKNSPGGGRPSPPTGASLRDVLGLTGPE
jgi:hypothetical protein